jgi:hypothetical protein
MLFPPLRPFSSKRYNTAPKTCQMLLNWESFLDEIFKFKMSIRCGTTTYALIIDVARPCLSASELAFTTTLSFSLSWHGNFPFRYQVKRGGEQREPLLLF